MRCPFPFCLFSSILIFVFSRFFGVLCSFEMLSILKHGFISYRIFVWCWYCHTYGMLFIFGSAAHFFCPVGHELQKFAWHIPSEMREMPEQMLSANSCWTESRLNWMRNKLGSFFNEHVYDWYDKWMEKPMVFCCFFQCSAVNSFETVVFSYSSLAWRWFEWFFWTAVV